MEGGENDGVVQLTPTKEKLRKFIIVTSNDSEEESIGYVPGRHHVAGVGYDLCAGCGCEPAR